MIQIAMKSNQLYPMLAMVSIPKLSHHLDAMDHHPSRACRLMTKMRKGIGRDWERLAVVL